MWFRVWGCYLTNPTKAQPNISPTSPLNPESLKSVNRISERVTLCIKKPNLKVPH